MAKSEAQLSAPLSRQDTAWLMAASLAALLPHALHLPAWVSLGVLGLMAWRFLIWRKNSRLTPRWLLFLVAILAMLAASIEYQSFFGREVGVAILAFLMALKLLEMRSRRDALSVVMLGFFLLLTHYFYSQSIATGIWLIACFFLLTSTLIHLYGGPRPHREVLTPAAIMLLESIPLMLVLWILFPRISGPIWGVGIDTNAGITRLAQEMSPGSLSSLATSGAIALRAEFLGGIPNKESLYWRGPVLDSFDGKTWRASTAKSPVAGTEVDLGTSVYRNNLGIKAPTIQANGTPIAYSLTLEPHSLQWILPLDMPIRLPAGAFMTSFLDVRAKEPIRSRQRFEFVSAPSYTVNARELDTVLKGALIIDQDRSPQAAALAKDWARIYQSPQDISRAALEFFRKENFSYTLRPALLGENPIDDFLFNSRRGFCEHYASAYAVLMRLAGIPARVVIGYQGGETNPIDGLLTVRQSDAHAWAEIWIAGQGWVRVDPTAAVAPSRIERGMAEALTAQDLPAGLVILNSQWLKAARNRWEAVNNVWNQWVIGYDTRRQRSTLQSLGLSNPQARTMILLALGFILTLMGAVAAIMLAQRQTRGQPDRVWSALCRAMRGKGVKRQPWEGPFDFAHRAADLKPELREILEPAAQAYARLKYGHPREDDLWALKNLVRQLKSQAA